MNFTSPDGRHAIGSGRPAVSCERPPSMARPFPRIVDPTVVPRTNKIAFDQVMSERKQMVIRDAPPSSATNVSGERPPDVRNGKARARTKPQDHRGRTGGSGDTPSGRGHPLAL